MAVTAVALMYQWADTTRMARGSGTAAPKAAHASVYRLCSRAFMGLPCPMKAAGIASFFISSLLADYPTRHRSALIHRMMRIEEFSRLAAQEDGLVVVGATRADGSVQASVVNAGVLRHPGDGTPVVGLVARGNALKLRLFRRRPVTAITVLSDTQWVTVEGTAELAGPDDPHPDVAPADLPALLRTVFIAAGGTHDDWPTYDRVMAEERRTAVLVRPQRVYGVIRY
jgi:PPOX class probable F420-dependent enzyme